MKLRIVYEGEANAPVILTGAKVSGEFEFEANDRITLYQVADTFLRHVTGQPTRFDEESSLRRAHQEELDRQKASAMRGVASTSTPTPRCVRSSARSRRRASAKLSKKKVVKK